MSDYQFNQIVLTQMESVIIQLSTTQYVSSLDVLSQASIGQHVRHILDFYLCLLHTENDIICYDQRERDPKIERDPGYAIDICRNISAQLPAIGHDRRIEIHSDMNGRKLQYQSSLGRELVYAFDHAVHHLALIKIGLKAAAPEIDIPENLGVAPSTVQYRKNQECAQ